jgi:hypothetical protein
MRTRVSLDVNGKTVAEIHRRAKEALVNFLEIPEEDLDRKTDIEIDVVEFRVPTSAQVFDSEPKYVGHVFAKLK